MQQAVWRVAVLTSSACNGAVGLATRARTRAYRDRGAREQLSPGTSCAPQYRTMTRPD